MKCEISERQSELEEKQKLSAAKVASSYNKNLI